MSLSSSGLLTRAHVEHPALDPTLQTVPVRFTSYYAALGLTMRLETNDERIRAAGVGALGPEVDLGGSPPDVTVRVMTHHVDEEPGWQPLQPLVRITGGAFTVAASRASVIAGYIPAGFAGGFVSDSAANDLEYARVAFVQSPFFQFAHAASLVVVHSACLVWNGQSILLRGLSGAGKSTLCYAALQRGWSLVAEDAVFIRTRREVGEGHVQPEELELYGIPWQLHLLPDAPRFFPELASEPAFERLSGKRKIGVNILDRFPGQALRSTSLGSTVFMTRSSSGAPHLRPVERDEALQLLDQTKLMNEAEIAAYSGLWDAFLAHPCWLLSAGSDPAENVAMLEATL